MNALRRPTVWLPIAIVALTLSGMFLLYDPGATQITERDRRFYWSRHYWYCAFDALSATSGVGILKNSYSDIYTDRGRAILGGLGAAGGMLSILAYVVALRRMQSQSGPRNLVVLTLVAANLLLIVLSAFALRSPAGTSRAPASVNLLVSIMSLGFPLPTDQRTSQLLHAAIGFVSTLVVGWFLIGGSRRKRIVLLVVYVTFLAAITDAAALVETPRGYRHVAPTSDRIASQDLSTRAVRIGIQVLSTAGAGRPTESLGEGQVSEATKLLLALAVIVGGPLPGLSGGITILGLLGVVTLIRRSSRARGADPPPSETAVEVVWAHYALAILGMILMVAFGLLIIESRTAAVGQSAPTFGDALLDAASLVSGSNLTTGLCATITDPNLSSGMFQSVDLYQYGLCWLLLAIVAGKLVPLAILWRAGGRPRSA